MQKLTMLYNDSNAWNIFYVNQNHNTFTNYIPCTLLIQSTIRKLYLVFLFCKPLHQLHQLQQSIIVFRRAYTVIVYLIGTCTG